MAIINCKRCGGTLNIIEGVEVVETDNGRSETYYIIPEE